MKKSFYGLKNLWEIWVSFSFKVQKGKTVLGENSLQWRFPWTCTTNFLTHFVCSVFQQSGQVNKSREILFITTFIFGVLCWGGGGDWCLKHYLWTKSCRKNQGLVAYKKLTFTIENTHVVTQKLLVVNMVIHKCVLSWLNILLSFKNRSKILSFSFPQNKGKRVSVFISVFEVVH